MKHTLTSLNNLICHNKETIMLFSPLVVGFGLAVLIYNVTFAIAERVLAENEYVKRYCYWKLCRELSNDGERLVDMIKRI